MKLKLVQGKPQQVEIAVKNQGVPYTEEVSFGILEDGQVIFQESKVPEDGIVSFTIPPARGGNYSYIIETDEGVIEKPMEVITPKLREITPKVQYAEVDLDENWDNNEDVLVETAADIYYKSRAKIKEFEGTLKGTKEEMDTNVSGIISDIVETVKPQISNLKEQVAQVDTKIDTVKQEHISLRQKQENKIDMLSNTLELYDTKAEINAKMAGISQQMSNKTHEIEGLALSATRDIQKLIADRTLDKFVKSYTKDKKKVEKEVENLREETWKLGMRTVPPGFPTIKVSGQDNIDAGAPYDELTIVAGSNMTITTNKNTKTLTFASSGGGGGGTPGGNDTEVQFNDGGSFGGDPHFTYDKTNDVLHVHKIAGDATDGLIIESANGTDIGILGAANTANVSWYGSHNFSTATQDTIAAFTGAGKTLGSLDTATYPSLTELSYVKGVTSSIQTQLNAFVNGMIYKGNWDASAGTFPGGGVAQIGWFYTVSVGGTVNSVVFNVGDRLIAIANNASTTTYASNWTLLDATDAVTSVFGRTGNVVATAGDYTATLITNTPAGNISATTVQAAINELDTEKQPLDTQLTSLAGLSYTGNALKVVRVNAGETDFELGTVSATPGGSANQIQYNNAGVLGGIAEIERDDTLKTWSTDVSTETSDAFWVYYVHNAAETEYSYLAVEKAQILQQTTGDILFEGDTVSFDATGGIYSLSGGGSTGILSFANVTGGNKTFTFPNATGTVALTSDIPAIPFTLASASGPASLQFAEDTDNGTNKVTIKAPASLSADYTLTLPVDDGTANQVLTTDGSGVLSWATPSGSGDVTAASSFGTDNVIIKSDGTGKGVQATGITIADTTNNMSGLQKLTVGIASTATGAIDIVGTTSGTVTVKTADAAGTWTLTLPANDGDANQFLQTNGSGVTTWATPTAPALKGCRLTKSGGQNFTGTTLTVLTWDTEKFDTDTMHDNVTNTERITFTTAGYYMVSFVFNSDTNAIAYSGVRLNGSTYIHKVGIGNSGSNTANGTTGSFPYYFSASDYIELFGSFGATVTSKSGEDGCMFSAVLLTTS